MIQVKCTAFSFKSCMKYLTKPIAKEVIFTNFLVSLSNLYLKDDRVCVDFTSAGRLFHS